MFGSATTANSVSVREAQELVRQESLEIAQGLKRQDAGLLDQLIVRYQHRLLRYLLYLTSNREQAEDLFQEVWMRVLVLRFHEDLSLEEIANVTRAPLSTVKSRLYRGLASMKPKLTGSYASE